MAETLTVSEATEALRRDIDVDPSRDPECFDAGMVLLGSLIHGPNIKRIASWSGIPHVRVATVSRNLRQCGVWKGKCIDAQPWFDENGGAVAFLLDVMVGAGLCERREQDDDEPLYWSTEDQSMTEVAIDALKEILGETK